MINYIQDQVLTRKYLETFRKVKQERERERELYLETFRKENKERERERESFPINFKQGNH